MDEKLLKVLEFDEIRTRLAEFAVSSRAKKEILEISPDCDYEKANRNLRLTDEAYTVKYKYSVNPIAEFDDISEVLDKAKAGAVLRPGELLKTANVMRSARIAKSEIGELGEDVSELKVLVSALMPDRIFEKQISDAVASDNELKDDASDKLKELRRKIHGANAKLKEKLAGYTRNGNLSKYLQDNIVTVRLGRFVLPVKSECRSMVPGLIHDQSGSGSTVFIEPFAVVELNNELKYLQMEEQREIERILAELSVSVAERSDMLYFALERCTMLDIIFAKCAYSVSINGVMPELNNGKRLFLKNARHPLIDSRKIVPVTVEVGEKYDILVVTGPNTGGKTVCLKTVGLCCLMAYCGIMVPCDKGSVVAVYDEIFCDLGDEQSIEQSLSTFSAHIVNVIRITDGISPRSLVLLDELGSGTDPVEGAALSVGILKYFELIGCKGIVTTHFNELKEYALVSERLMNACMQFDEDTLKPTYKLMVGVPGVSNALKIARTLGLNEYIIDKAYESISDEQIRFETVLREAQYAKMQAERQKAEVEEEKRLLLDERLQLEAARKKVEEKQERIQNNAKAETARLVANMVSKASELLEELKETVKSADEEALRKARALLSKLENVKSESEDVSGIVCVDFVPSIAKVGQRIIVRSLGSEGVLLSLADKKGMYKVSVGNLQMAVKAENLACPLVANKENKPKEKAKRVVLSAPAEPSVTEVKLLGMTVSEAIEVLEPIIISSPHGSMLRIVHGKGTGALGKGVQAYLKTRSDIASYRYGRYGEGDTGVTLAEIK